MSNTTVDGYKFIDKCKKIKNGDKVYLCKKHIENTKIIWDNETCGDKYDCKIILFNGECPYCIFNGKLDAIFDDPFDLDGYADQTSYFNEMITVGYDDYKRGVFYKNLSIDYESMETDYLFNLYKFGQECAEHNLPKKILRFLKL